MSRRDSIFSPAFDFSNATDFEVFTSDIVSNTITTYPNYDTKLVGTSNTNEPGTYVINWSFDVSNSGNNNITWYQIQWKQTSSTTWITLSEVDVLIPRGDSYIPVSGFKTINNMSISTFDLRIRWSRESGTARIRNANIYLFRVSG